MSGFAIAALRAVLVVVMYVPAFALAQEDVVVKRLEIVQPRTFGYQLGDKFERRISFLVHEPYVLDTEALPEPGKLNTWLAIEAPDIRQNAMGSYTRMQLRLIYQVTNVEPGITQVPVPHHDLVFTDGKKQTKVLVPAIRIDLNTVTDPRATDLQADQPPRKLLQRYKLLALYGALLLVALAGLAWRYFGFTLADKQRPFTQTWKRWRRRRRAQDEATTIAALRDIHQAFNDTAGKTVFAETLDTFFTEHRHFDQLRQPINDFFIYSRAVFFAAGDDEQATQYTSAQLVDFLRQCSDAERGLH